MIRPAAESDIDSAAQCYVAQENVDLGLRFYEAVERTFTDLLEQPGLGAVQQWLTEELAGCRRWFVARPFEVHQVFYLATETRLEVIRVLHGARDLRSVLG